MESSLFNKFSWLFLSIILIIISVGFYHVFFTNTNIICSDINSLLPASGNHSSDVFAKRIASESIFILHKTKHITNEHTYTSTATSHLNHNGSLTSLTTEAVYDDLSQSLNKLKHVKVVSYIDKKQIGTFFYKYRYSFPPNKIFADYSETFDFVTSALYSPFGGITDNEIKHDPFMSVRNLVSNLGAVNGDFTVDHKGRLFKNINDESYYLIRIIADDNFSNDDRKDLMVLSFEKKAEYQKFGYELLFTGSSFFAESAELKSVNDMTIIGIASIICLLTVLVLIFKSVLSILSSFLVLAISLATGFAAVILLFNSIHIITLAIGSTLIGICFDYILHMMMFRCNHDSDNSCSARSTLFKPLLLSLLTSLAAYLVMAFTSLNILRQLAVFAFSSLLTTFGIVYFWISRIKFKKTAVSSYLLGKLKVLTNKLLSKANLWLSANAMFLCWCISITLVIATKVLFIADDDVSSMQKLDQDLLAMDQSVKTIINNDRFNTSWFILEGENVENVLGKCKQLNDRYNQFIKQHNFDQNNAVNSVLFPCKYIPSKNLQLSNIKKYKSFFPNLKKAYFDNDIDVSYADAGLDNPPIFSLDEFPLSIKLLIDERAILIKVKNSNKIISSFFSSEKELFELNPHKSWSNAFNKYHRSLSTILVISLLLSCFVWFITIKRNIFIGYIIPITMGISLGLLANYVLHGYFNLFTTLASFMIIGLGSDYCIFFAKTTKKNGANAILSIFIAWLTTESAFGILAISSIPIISSFGTVIAFGLAITFITSLSSYLILGFSNK